MIADARWGGGTLAMFPKGYFRSDRAAWKDGVKVSNPWPSLADNKVYQPVNLGWLFTAPVTADPIEHPVP